MARRSLVSLSLAALVAAGIGLWMMANPTPAPGQSAAGPAGRVVLAWGVGGVLTEDGRLWQYRPEKSRWVNIDESFRLDGEQRHVLPLPVPARDIRFMQGFGFLVTRTGTAWLYDLDANRWRNLGSPGR